LADDDDDDDGPTGDEPVPRKARPGKLLIGIYIGSPTSLHTYPLGNAKITRRLWRCDYILHTDNTTLWVIMYYIKNTCVRMNWCQQA